MQDLAQNCSADPRLCGRKAGEDGVAAGRKLERALPIQYLLIGALLVNVFEQRNLLIVGRGCLGEGFWGVAQQMSLEDIAPVKSGYEVLK